MDTETKQGILRIKENIKYVESHFLHYEDSHVIEPGSPKRKCRYCGVDIGFGSGVLEKCEVGTRQIQENARENISGGESLIKMIESLPNEERKSILGFLNQCLQHHHM